MRLETEVALITGAGRGIGRATAIRFAEEGAKVVVCDIDDDAARQVASEIVSRGGDAIAFKCDVSDRESVRKMVDSAVGRFGGVTILVNNAGLTRDALVQNMTTEQWNTVFDICVRSIFNCVQAVSKYLMKARSGGKIVNVSSVSGQVGTIGQFNYSAAKSAVIGCTKALAKEWARYGVTVNCVAPGFIETRLTEEKETGTIVMGERVGIPKKVRERLLEEIPMRRMGEPLEVANAILFLASSEADYITGHVLNVNGGYYM